MNQIIKVKNKEVMMIYLYLKENIKMEKGVEQEKNTMIMEK